MIVLYTPSTGFPDLEVKIAYGLARVGIEAFGINNVKIIPLQGFYSVHIHPSHYVMAVKQVNQLDQVKLKMEI